MSLPIITPAEGQPLHHLMRELEELGGVRHQDFRVTSGLARNGYQVSPELYRAWLEHHSGDTPDPEQGDSAEQVKSPDAEDTASADADKDAADAKAADDGKDADKDAAPAEPEAETKPEAETQAAAKATTSTAKPANTKRSQRG